VFVRNDHQLFLDFISCDKYESVKLGTTQNVRYKGILRFEFPKNYLPAAEFQEVRAAIEAIVAPQKESETTGPAAISIGQTPQEVEAILGKPDKVANLGSKQIYVYKDLKVIFVEGKVADVQ
jgi:hypothetical protein